jgi:hypothetical protein
MEQGGQPNNLNARRHGAYSFRDRGEQALEPERRSRLAELSDQVKGRAGLVELMQDRAIRAVMICELLEGHVSEEARAGRKAHEIPALRQLPAFWNSAQRAITSLLSIMPENENHYSVELDHINEVINDPGA